MVDSKLQKGQDFLRVIILAKSIREQRLPARLLLGRVRFKALKNITFQGFACNIKRIEEILIPALRT